MLSLVLHGVGIARLAELGGAAAGAQRRAGAGAARAHGHAGRADVRGDAGGAAPAAEDPRLHRARWRSGCRSRADDRARETNAPCRRCCTWQRAAGHENCARRTAPGSRLVPARSAADPAPAPLRVLLIDDGAHRVSLIHDELSRQGHLVVGVLDSALLIHDCVLRLQPDVVIVDSESPTRDTLEHLSTMSASCPRPVVVFSEDASPGADAAGAEGRRQRLRDRRPAAAAPAAGAAGGDRALRAGPRAARPARDRRSPSCRSASWSSAPRAS